MHNKLLFVWVFERFEGPVKPNHGNRGKGGEKSENFGRLTKWGFHSERSVGAVWHGRFDYLSNRIWGSGRHGAVWRDTATESAEVPKTKAHV